MSLYGPKQLVDSFRTVRKNTILVAEDVPEKNYGYRPTSESRSVAETLVHIASLARFDRFIHEEKHLSSFEGFDFGALIKEGELEEKRPRSKAEIIELLRTEGERWAQWVEQLPEAFLSEQVRMPGGSSRIVLSCSSEPRNMKCTIGLSLASLSGCSASSRTLLGTGRRPGQQPRRSLLPRQSGIRAWSHPKHAKAACLGPPVPVE